MISAESHALGSGYEREELASTRPPMISAESCGPPRLHQPGAGGFNEAADDLGGELSSGNPSSTSSVPLQRGRR